ncbi:MAG TPA: protein-L-isoaspartate(D-aspartate) O-methyltransferase [Usitatibacteraceae bacterium]|nr:protein-L-isoaspartate(D-aspartate) O-methyltransferase [Usitatibacteraceae bacterium]
MSPVGSSTGRFQGLGMTSDRTRARMIEALRKCGIRNEAVLAAMAEVPRHAFVDEALQDRAYEADKALPIGHGQTISTPEIVGIMTELLCENGVPKKVLEIGTGCGYQTAILGKLCKEVYTVERIAALMDRARRVLRELRYFNIIFKHADGHLGYRDGGPYDGILMTAAAASVPEELKAQLKVGGRMVLPVGRDGAVQQLHVIDRTEEGFREKIVHDVRFVPLLPGTV